MIMAKKNIINHPWLGMVTTYKNGDDWGMVYYCFTHIIPSGKRLHSELENHQL